MTCKLPLGWLLLAVAGCSNLQDKQFTGVGELGTETDADTDTDLDTDADSDTDTDTDTVPDDTGATTPGGGGFDQPGDVVDYVSDDNGNASVDLTDASGDSNQDQEFYMVVVNTGADPLGYSLRYFPTSTERPAPPEHPRTLPRPEPRHIDAPHAVPPPSEEITEADIGTRQTEFLVRSDIEETDQYAAVNATLWALGDNVAIWVDDDVPIDWDIDCDGVVDVPDPYDAYGFDNCDLSTVAEIIDDNIVPNVRTLYGNESDINGDGKVSVVITPVLNAITLTSEDEEDWNDILESYAEPTVDLYDYDARTNPGSDEQEVIYVYAPDPYGFFNPYTSPTVEDYTSFRLAAQVAKSFTTLVTFNAKVLDGGGSVEEDWLNNALGTFAADYCGFGAAWHLQAWEYLDSPHLQPLVAESENGSLDNLTYGAQYLFARWLYDYADQSGIMTGREFLNAIAQSTDVGTAAVESAASPLGDDFASLVVKWQVALLTSGVQDTDGNDLVDTSVWPAYAPVETIDAPPASPGSYFGANGYQRGVDLRGYNRAWTDGTTDTPTEITEHVVRLEGTDAYLYTPGFEFAGYVEGNYGAQVIRLTGITYDQASAVVQATGSGLVGAVVRWNDPTEPDYAVEDIYSATDANAVTLPSLPDDGSPIYGAGEISDVGYTYEVDATGDLTSAEVQDTDRWLLDLSDQPWGSSIPVAVWLDRHYVDTDGTPGPDDPWVAIVPADWVPVPTVDGTTSATCNGGESFAYPTSVLEYLYSQVFLSGTLIGDVDEDFDPCGEQSAVATSCADDWDGDGVTDADEPLPDTLYEQILVAECTANGNVAPSPSGYDTDWLDWDERDEDEEASFNPSYNTGGVSGGDGEEGYVEAELTGGQQYLIIVGAGDGTGPYELSVRRTR